MADNKQLSPGVKVIEKDLTQVVPRVSVSTGAVAGKFAWGPVMSPQLISNETDLATLYGKPDDSNYESWYTAANFLGYSNSLYVNRADSINLKNAVATSTGGVESITVTTTGSGFTSAPSVVIGAPNKFDGVQAAATAVLSGGSLITTTSSGNQILNAALILNGGTGFSVGDKVFFSTPEQTVDLVDDNGILTSTYRNAIGEVLTVSSGAITTIKITYIGAGYIAPATITGFTQADGSARATGTFSHATIPVTTSGIKRIDVDVVGSGYTTAPAVTYVGGGSTSAVLTAVVSATGIKVKNKAHYESNYADGQGVYGMVAAKYAGALGNSLRFSMADSATFDTTLDGVFSSRTTLESFENSAELTKLRRRLPGHDATQAWAVPSNISGLTIPSESCANKTIRTSVSNVRFSGAGTAPFGNIPVGTVDATNPVSTATYYKITLGKDCPAMVATKLQGATISYVRSGAAPVQYGVFDGYAKRWSPSADAYIIDTSSFYVRRTNSNVAAVLTNTGTDVLVCDSLTNALVVRPGSLVKGTSYTIKSLGTTNFILLGASSNKVGVTFTASGAGAVSATSGEVYSTNVLGAVTQVSAVEVLKLTSKAKAELNNATCDKEWEYGSQFTRAPGTSNFASNVGGANDELHMILVDTTGFITGQAGSIIQKWQGVSKAYDAKATDGTSSYYKNIINGSPWLWWLDHPEIVESAGRSVWGVSAVNTNFCAIDDGYSATAIASNPVKGHSLVGGSDGESLSSANIMDAYTMYNDSAAFDISLIPTGNADANIATWIVENVAALRKDCVAFLSAPLLIGTGNDIATQMVTYRNNLEVGDTDGSYAVMDSGWKYQYDRYNDKYRWIPLNADTAGTCAYTDNVADSWFSPGGFSRGQIKNVTKLAFNPTQAQRDVLYQGGINPIVSFPGEGTILFGDKTMQKKSSAFDRINVRRLFIVLEKSISQAAKYQLFEYNDDFTRAQFKNLVEPFLRDVQGRRGITDFKVTCDTTNNTPEVIDSNEFIADIYIKPNRSINYITLNFVATKTGVSFSSL